METKNKLYVLVDKKLNPIYAAVQGGHAVAEWLMYNMDIKYNKFACEHQPKWQWENEYLIYLAVNINHWEALLRKYDATSYVEFDEPDLKWQTTAIAVWEGGLPDELKRKIEKEQLLE